LDITEESDDEASDWYNYQMPFGKHKGRMLRSLVQTKEGRAYLKYLQSWEKLDSVAAMHINACLKEYSNHKHRRQGLLVQLKAEAADELEAESKRARTVPDADYMNFK
jgi:hypothetical protein